MLPRVFQIEATPRFNTVGVLKYGTLFAAFREGEFKPFTHGEKEILAALRYDAFNPETDYICLTGPVINVSLFLATIVANYDGPFKILMFNANSSKYDERLFQGKP